MKKRTLTFLLTLIMCIALLPVTALADGNLTRAELAVMVYNKFRPAAVGEGAEFNDIDSCTPEQQAAIRALAAAGVLSGNSAGTFSPDGLATRGMSAVIIWRTSGVSGAGGEDIFDDIADTPYAPAVNALVSNGVLLSSDAIDGGFKPDDAAAEAVVTLWLSRMDSAEVPDADTTGDAAAGDGGDATTGGGDGSEKVYIASPWAQDELKKADALGLIPDSLQGADLTQDITRAEFAAVTVKAYEVLTGTRAEPVAENPFTDCEDPEVLKAYNVGITNGMEGTYYKPDRILSREQMATMLTRVYKRVTMPGWTLDTDGKFPLSYTMPPKFADDASISTWAYDSVYFMAANKVINGVEDNKFAPKNGTPAEEAVGYANASREQAIVLALRIVENLGE